MGVVNGACVTTPSSGKVFIAMPATDSPTPAEVVSILTGWDGKHRELILQMDIRWIDHYLLEDLLLYLQ